MRRGSNVASASGGSTGLNRSDFGKFSSTFVPCRLKDTSMDPRSFTRSNLRWRFLYTPGRLLRPPSSGADFHAPARRMCGSCSSGRRRRGPLPRRRCPPAVPSTGDSSRRSSVNAENRQANSFRLPWTSQGTFSSTRDLNTNSFSMRPTSVPIVLFLQEPAVVEGEELLLRLLLLHGELGEAELQVRHQPLGARRGQRRSRPRSCRRIRTAARGP